MKCMKMHEGKPGSAGRLTGVRDFAFGDQRLAVGSRPAVASKWKQFFVCSPVTAGRTVPGSHSRPSSRTFFDGIVVRNSLKSQNPASHRGRVKFPPGSPDRLYGFRVGSAVPADRFCFNRDMQDIQDSGRVGRPGRP